MCCMSACLAFCEAMRPKLAGVTSTSISSPSWASDLSRRASKREIWSCLEATLSETTSLANALMSPVLGSMAQRNSRAGPTAFLAADSNASSTAFTRTSLLMPFSRSQYSNIAKNSEFIHTSIVPLRRTKKSAESSSPTSARWRTSNIPLSVGSVLIRNCGVKSKRSSENFCNLRPSVPSLNHDDTACARFL